jgi:hypothetical protein
MSRMVVDTNVAVCANGEAAQASPECVIACVDALERLKRRGMVLIDVHGHILDEYVGRLSRSGQPGVGDAFLRWLIDNQANRYRVRQVRITPDGTGGYAEFPADPALAGFDRDDRKFVAVALAASPRRPPPILNATDSDWKTFEAELAMHHVRIEFLCPELMGT